jgi:hypothetical protein
MKVKTTLPPGTQVINLDDDAQPGSTSSHPTTTTTISPTDNPIAAAPLPPDPPPAPSAQPLTLATPSNPTTSLGNHNVASTNELRNPVSEGKGSSATAPSLPVTATPTNELQNSVPESIGSSVTASVAATLTELRNSVPLPVAANLTNELQHSAPEGNGSSAVAPSSPGSGQGVDTCAPVSAAVSRELQPPKPRRVCFFFEYYIRLVIGHILGRPIVRLLDVLCSLSVTNWNQ